MTTSRDDAQPTGLPDDPAGILTAARARRAVADQAEADLLQLAVRWAITHPAESIEEAETIGLRSFGDTAIPLAGPGAPLVAEFSLAEFAATIALPTEAGKRYVGHALELRYRLPRLWKRVVGGDLAAWKARRIADQTTHLSIEAARYVDRHLAPVAHKVRPSQVDRLLEEAIARHMPEEAEERRRAAWDQTHLTINHHGVGIAGTSTITGEIDYLDALDLDDALRAEAQRLGDLGNTKTLDQRRATALGNIARRDLTLDYPTTQPTDAHRPRRRGHARGNQKARGPAGGAPPPPLRVSHPRHRPRPECQRLAVGRVENTRSPVTAETIRDWVGRPDLHVTVKPVVDLAEHVSVEAYEVPDRIAEPAALRDISCVFPWCTRPARRLRPDQHPCDNDHPIPYHQGGPTCSCQIAPLCRRHHRLKTHGGWPTTSSNPAPTCGPAPTATSTSATTPAPSTSHETTTAAHHPQTPDATQPPPARPDHSAPQPAVPHPRRALRHSCILTGGRRPPPLVEP